MKRIYIKPETTYLACESIEFLANSAETEWHTGTQGQGDDHTIGGDQPNPNQDAKGIYGYEDLWGDF